MPRTTGKIKLDNKIKLDGAFVRSMAEPTRITVLPGGWWLWCLIGLAVGLCVWQGGRRYLRSQLSAHLASAQTEQAALQSIDALLRLDGDATIDVSRGLAHPEFMVANAAYRALNQQLDAWSSLKASEQLRRMQQIVTELERVPAEVDQDHRILVTGLASRIYAEALSNREPGAALMLAACKRLMTHSNGHADVVQVAGVPESTALVSAAGRNPAHSPVPPPLPPLEKFESALVRDSDSAIAPSPIPRLGSSNDDQSGSSTSRGVMHLTAAPIAESANNKDSTEAALLSTSSSPAARLSDLTSTRSKSLRTNVPAVDANAVLEDTESTLSGMDNLPIDQLVRLLPSLQPRVSQAASLALRRKGMSDQNLDLAMRLANGTSNERQMLLQSLAQRDDLDPRPWLLWMAADGDSRVREQATGLLSPLLDTEVRRQLRLLLNKERDEQVAQTMRSILVR